MRPPEGESEPRPPTRSNRLLGLVAAVGFSIAMWAFIAMAVLGLVLKVIGPKDAEEGLNAAGLSMSQIFNPDSKATEADPATAPAADLGAEGAPITTLDGRPLTPAQGKAPAPQPAPQPAPATAPR